MFERQGETITLARDCVAVQIPAGVKTVLEKGTKAWLTQSLGGSFTLQTQDGYLVRVDGKDADAIGQEAEAGETESDDASLSREDVEKRVWEELRTVYDPEIPVNIVDLGLVYDCKVHQLGEEGGYKVDITMTLTAPGCGMGDVLRNDAEAKVSSVRGVTVADVQLVIDPPWNPTLMSESARLQLGMF